MRRIVSFAVCALIIAGPARAEPCAFNQSRLSFEGTAIEQAQCLLRRVEKWGHLGPQLTQLPPALNGLLGTTPSIKKDKLAQKLKSAGLDASMLTRPVSRAKGGAASAPFARYFVIHDTSSPWLGDKAFPPGIDSDPSLFKLDTYIKPDAVAHAFVGRTGLIRFGHDFSVPWRATKREKAIGLASKGLFLHIENIQPRRREPSGGPKNDAIAPIPGLSPAQYDSLALLYVAASHRAKSWLIPAFHAALDEGISDGHDDPQNFDLAAFDEALARLLQSVE
jgi:hypothetical protein